MGDGGLDSAARPPSGHHRFGIGNLHLLDGSPKVFQNIPGLAHCCDDLWIAARFTIGGIYTDPPPSDAGVEVGEVVGNRRCEARRVVRIEAGNRPEHGTGVRSRAGHWANVVEAGRESEDTIATHSSPSGLETGDAVGRAREANG